MKRAYVFPANGIQSPRIYELIKRLCERDGHILAILFSQLTTKCTLTLPLSRILWHACRMAEFLKSRRQPVTEIVYKTTKKMTKKNVREVCMQYHSRSSIAKIKNKSVPGQNSNKSLLTKMRGTVAGVTLALAEYQSI